MLLLKFDVNFSFKPVFLVVTGRDQCKLRFFFFQAGLWLMLGVISANCFFLTGVFGWFQYDHSKLFLSGGSILLKFSLIYFNFWVGLNVNNASRLLPTAWSVGWL